jgi:hypothetical protein
LIFIFSACWSVADSTSSNSLQKRYLLFSFPDLFVNSYEESITRPEFAFAFRDIFPTEKSQTQFDVRFGYQVQEFIAIGSSVHFRKIHWVATSAPLAGHLLIMLGLIFLR